MCSNRKIAPAHIANSPHSSKYDKSFQLIFSCKLVLILIATLFTIASTAQPFVEKRKKDVQKMFERYPCIEFKEEYRRIWCGYIQDGLMQPETLNSNAIVWNKTIRKEEETLIGWSIEDDRFRFKSKLQIGMTAEYIYTNVLGPPDRRNDTLDARGKTSQWVYETDSESLYLYFNRNGVLTSIQNRR